MTQRLLTRSDLKFIGAFKLPRTVYNEPTSYAPGCLAHRRLADGTHRLMADSHIQTGKVYELRVPDTLTTTAPFPEVKAGRLWGDIFKRVRADGTEYGPMEAPVTSIRWSSSNVYWTYGEQYNNENKDAPTVGHTGFKNGIATPVQPIRVPNVHQLWVRGGTLQIPLRYVGKLGNATMVAGFGGYYSIFEGGSYGPALATTTGRVLLGYPDPNRCVRDANYRHAVNNTWVGKDPIDGIGTWNATDEIGGERHGSGGFWIETPEIRGIGFLVYLGTGRIAYEDGGVRCAGYANYLYVYNPDDLIRVYGGILKSWQPQPKIYPLENPAPGFKGRAAGCAWDMEMRRLYVTYTEAYKPADSEDMYPMVSVFQVGPEKVPA